MTGTTADGSAASSGGRSGLDRVLLPALAFKAVVIGGGYATGRELVEFFLPSGARGGLAAMLLAAAIWSAICALTFLFARAAAARDYQAFFGGLLGRYAILFEVLLILYTITTLSVFGAAAGAIGESLLGWPTLAGTLLLAGATLLVAARGNGPVERLFKLVSILLYGTYAAFLLLCLARFGPRIGAAFARPAPTPGWIAGGITYASYNVIGAVLILSSLRHQRSRRDAIAAGLLCGPLAMLPAIIFFICLAGFADRTSSQTLPADFLLRQLGLPWFHWLFELMIFAALLESRAGNVHAINERLMILRRRRGRADTVRIRLAVTILLLAFAMGVAQAIGLVALIARGYRLLAWLVLAIFVMPLITVGVWRLASGRANPGVASFPPPGFAS